MRRDFSRVAIVNRGEAAMRAINAIRELNLERSLALQVGPLRAIAVATAAERRARFAREADEVVVLDSDEALAYLDLAALERALVRARADAAWVGWGFVAERPEFVELCDRLGVVFVGPDAGVMRRLGDKIGAKRLAEEAGVPLAPWSGGPVGSVAEAVAAAERVGFPLVVKAAAGGGGRGIRMVHEPEDLPTAFESARAEGAKTFGDGTVFLERLIGGARHVEVQVVADEHGTAWALGVRDCSVQRRNQKVLEESSSVALGPDQQRELGEAAVRLAKVAGYRNAGTVEFLYEPAERRFAFLEVNTRLQVEHPVTELTTGSDLVKLQFHVAAGGRLEGPPPDTFGHAIEARLNAEDPQQGFAPAPGTIDVLRWPTGPGIRVDTGVAEGDVIPPEYDSMIAKVIAWGATRNEARARLRRALAETVVLVEGGTTNRSFLLDLLERPEVAAGEVDTGWLDRVVAEGGFDADRHGAVALLAAAIDAFEDRRAEERARFYTAAARGRPQLGGDASDPIDLRHRGAGHRVQVRVLGPGRYRVALHGQVVEVAVERQDRSTSRLTMGSRTFRVLSFGHGVDHLVDVEGASHRFSLDDGGLVRAPAAAVVIAVPVAPGDHVEAGSRVAVLEAMKMEVVISAPLAGRVSEVLVAPNVQVEAGAPLLRLEPVGTEEEEGDADGDGRGGLDLGSLETAEDLGAGAGAGAGPGEADCLVVADTADALVPGPAEARLDRLGAFVAGYDVTAAEAQAVLAAYLRDAPAPGPSGGGTDGGDPGAGTAPLELDVIECFADLVALTRDRRDEDAESAGLRSAREHFDTYLGSLDADEEGLPDRYREKLARALAHYDVGGFEPTPMLEEALLRAYRAQQRASEAVPVVLALLERAGRDRPAGGGGPGVVDDDRLREVLDRLSAATRHRYPVIASLAAGVRYRCFDWPVIAATRDEVDAAMRDHLHHLVTEPDAPDAAAHREALVDCAQPLIGLVVDPVAGTTPGGPGRPTTDPLVEVLARRYYRIRPLEDLRWTTLPRVGTPLLQASYDHEGLHCVVLGARAARSQLPAVLDDLARALPAAEADRSVLVDLYLHDDRPGGADLDTDEVAAWCRDALDRAALPPTVERVAIALCGAPGRSDADGEAGPNGAGGGSAEASGGGPLPPVVHQLTFRPAEEGDLNVAAYDAANGAAVSLAGSFVEDRVLRGLHPMIARRLNLWRLANFVIERLPAAPEVHLFRCVARENPADERLIAMAEVRDLTPVRDPDGRVGALPELEQVLAACCDALRWARARQPGRSDQLSWNRVQLYVWPEVDSPLDELLVLAPRIAPLTEGLGLEQVVIQGRFRESGDAPMRDRVVRLGYESGQGLTFRLTEPPTEPMLPLDDYTQKVLASRRRGYTYPYELVPLLARTAGHFTEYDLEELSPEAGGDAAPRRPLDNRLVPVDRPPGGNRAGVVVGLVTTPTAKHPEGMTRVAVLGDPTRALGSIAEAECRRLLGAIDLAEALGVPVEWFALSAGAKIAMQSGSENLDWVGRVLRRLVEHTQRGGEVNIVVAGINVGAQPYWNAEATMLMHTRGILVMTPQSAMVLTGKQALDYSGGVSAEDNFGIGGYERVMGPNGEAQYWAPDLIGARDLLFAHYEHTYVVRGERFPRRAVTKDPVGRDVRRSPHAADGGEFTEVGDLFSAGLNGDRKKPFDMRSLMRATIDADRPPLERWAEMREAETAIVYDAHLGGIPATVVGIESRPLPRYGAVPADGPSSWSAGTLFPLSSKKVARAINAASGNRPVVVLANLSGFDGSPESLRRLQLEYGAEIGRAIVNFDGPLVLCVVSRYHGGAFVVFSATLNDQMEVLAVEGSFASVIGGAPAAAVVFTSDVDGRTRADPRVRAAEAELVAAPEDERAAARARLVEVTAAVRMEKLGEVAAEFDAVHTVERAREVGSVHRIIPAVELRPALVAALERGMARSRPRR